MTTDEQIDKILETAGYQIYPYESNENRLKAKTAIQQLIVAARIEEVSYFVAKLDEQDPYLPLDDTPREYAHSKMGERIAELQHQLSNTPSASTVQDGVQDDK